MEASARPLVQIRHLSKAFPGVKALADCQFELRAGEVHALMGENGAGKSTLMKILAGVYQKDAGEIRIDGELVEIGTPRRAQALGIGIIHQELNLMPHLTAAQNIFIGREPRGRFGLFLDEAALNAGAAAIFARLHLALDPKVPVESLSVAKQQMVEIAKALSFHSRILIMDEPSAALNDAEIAELFAIIRQLKAQGVGIIYISHKMDELKAISDRVTVLRDGDYVGTREMATTSVDEIIRMMVGRHLGEARPLESAPPAGEIILEAKNISRGKAIRDASFTLRRGEILGLAGLMGAGRTELARAIFGADPIESGEIVVAGRKARISSPKDAVKYGIGYLSEDRKHFGLAIGMDVAANVTMASLRDFLSAGFFLRAEPIRQRARDFIAKLAIRTPSESQEVRLLSGGNQQKIVIAKWLLRDCDILFFDEPTRGIDVGAKSEIYKLIQSLAEAGKAIVMISSELPEILRMSHRILVMCEGRITGELSAGAANQEAIMRLATKRNAQEAPE